MTNRRSFMKGSAAVLGAATLFTPAILRAQTMDQIRVLTPFAFGTSFIEMLNAVSGGHYAANNLEATMEAGRGGSQTLQQLIAGQADFIRISSIEQMTAMEISKADLVCFSTLFQSSTFHVVSLKDRPINSAEEMRGKTVGLVSVGGSTEIFLDLMLDSAGVPAEEVRREVTGDTPAALQIMQAGRVDCFICSIAVIVELRLANAPVEVWSTDRYAPMPGQGYVALRSRIEERPEVFTRICKSLHASVEELMTGPVPPIFERASKDFELSRIDDPVRLSAFVETTANELWLSKGRENLMRNVPELWEAGRQTLSHAGMVKNEDASVYYDNTYVDEALRI
jgi:NitT/TauT family transport system substrate-binding protein